MGRDKENERSPHCAFEVSAFYIEQAEGIFKIPFRIHKGGEFSH